MLSEVADLIVSGQGEEADQHSERPKVVRRSFNPMTTYVYVAAGIFVSYSTFYMFGYEALIIVLLFFVVRIMHETHYILRNIHYGLARKAAYFNAGLAVACFVILVINAYWIMHFDTPLILPEADGLTLSCPLFIMTSVFGSRNVRLMYSPEQTAN